MTHRPTMGNNIYSRGKYGFEEWFVLINGKLYGSFKSAGDAMDYEICVWGFASHS